ncbi:MAG: hypothetical protein GX997_05730 [Bacteroidales bacterium]|nr:hypothetical protein [Bacteroidales bacterium]
MKNYFVSSIVAIAIFFTAFSCDDSNSGNYLFDIATVEVQDDETFVLRLDDGTRLWPLATDVRYVGKNGQRVFVNYTVLSEKENNYNYSIKINDIWDILTKSPILLTAENADSIGNDPVKINSIWVGSDFLNVDFFFNYGGVKPHAINLVKNTLVAPPDDGKIHLEFRHNSYQSLNTRLYEGLVCFDLRSLRVPTVDSVLLTIKVKDWEREKTFNLVYRYNDTAPKSAKSEKHIYTISSSEYY